MRNIMRNIKQKLWNVNAVYRGYLIILYR